MKYSIYLISAMLIFFLFSCDDSSSDPSDDGAVVALYSSFGNMVVGKANIGKANSFLADEVDSITLTNVRILISEIKFHEKNELDEEDNKTFKAGPFVYTADDNGDFKITEGTIDDGEYDKIKFEFHRFSASEIAQYANSAIFADFATEDRYNYIIEGSYFKDGNETVFTLKGNSTSNLSLNFDTPVILSEGQNNKIYLELDPTVIFSEDNSILDPSDPKNQNNFDNNLKEAIRALKK